MGARPGSSHNHLNRADESFESVDRDQSIRAILGVGPEFQYEILSKEDWVGRRLVADASAAAASSSAATPRNYGCLTPVTA